MIETDWFPKHRHPLVISPAEVLSLNAPPPYFDLNVCLGARVVFATIDNGPIRKARLLNLRTQEISEIERI